MRAGDPLLRFDLDLVARRAKSCVTPILLASPGTIVRRGRQTRALAAGDFLMEIEAGRRDRSPTRAARSCCARFSVPFDHGVHARPAALIAAALRPFAAEVAIIARGRSGNARSTVALMALGVHCGEVIEVRAVGVDAVAADRGACGARWHPCATSRRSSRTRTTRAVPSQVEGVVASRGFAIGDAVQLTREPDCRRRGAAAASSQERARSTRRSPW